MPLLAWPFWTHCLELTAATHGDSEQATIEVLRSLGENQLQLGDTRRAKPLFERALAGTVRQVGREHLSVAMSMTFISELAWHLQERNEAAKVLTDAAAILRVLASGDDQRTELCHTNLTSLRLAMGDIAGAREASQHSLLWHALSPDQTVPAKSFSPRSDEITANAFKKHIFGDKAILSEPGVDGHEVSIVAQRIGLNGESVRGSGRSHVGDITWGLIMSPIEFRFSGVARAVRSPALVSPTTGAPSQPPAAEEVVAISLSGHSGGPVTSFRFFGASGAPARSVVWDIDAHSARLLIPAAE